jgi:hypothetical protein
LRLGEHEPSLSAKFTSKRKRRGEEEEKEKRRCLVFPLLPLLLFYPDKGEVKTN